MTNSVVPPLTGRTADDLSSAFQRYKSETDGTTVMHRIARGYSDADISAISQFLAEETE